jgi:hypothetical protein
MVKLLVSALLTLTTASAVAADMYIYKDKQGKTLLVNVNPSEKNKRSKDTYIPVAQPSTTKSVQTGFEVPYGYRLPTKSDITGDWKRFNAPNHLEADFNGDGIKDEAYILPKEGSKLGYGVFVSINKANGGIQTGRKFQMFKLTSRDDMPPQSFAIELQKPSNKIWETACGKGYWECEIGEPAEFKIKNPSIMFCYIESGCTMYMWDSDKLSFKEIQFSD